jgi:glycosyltransferase involved in cell wall biosynthesis
MSRPHRVLMVTACAFPPEIRVLKEARSLRDAGYGSAVLCPPIDGRPARETWDGIEIFRPDVLAGAASAMDKILYQATFFSPAWFRAVRQTIDEYAPSALHVHDIWLARSVVAAHPTGKVVVDLHENMPAAVVEYLKGYRGALKLFNRIFKPRSRVLRYEQSVLNRSDRTLVVVEEAADRVRAEHARLAPEKVVVVENLESKHFLSASDPDGPSADETPSILYIGGFGPHRGLDTLIEAMKYLKAWDVAVRLDLIGARPSTYRDMLEELVDRSDVAAHVNMVEWVPAETVLSRIRGATIGAVPHHANPHTDNTIPHKLFQYMIAGTPVLVSTSAPLARTVTAARAGGVFRAGDAHHCAEVVRDMLQDTARLRQYGVNGHSYVMCDGHNWEDEAAPELIRMYDALLDGRP